MQGVSIKDFTLVERLGQGAMGEVWLAEQQLIKTRVAIKFLSDEVSRDSPQVKRFFNEAIAVSKIQHAGTVKIFDVGFHGTRAYMIMELLQGETLAQRIARSGRLPLSQVADLGQQIASILEATHGVGITHRDLKPDNIFIVPDGERASRQRIKILDFGIAKIGGAESQTASSSSMGTPAYMSPELWKDAANADPRSDIYALGCVVFEMCCGRPPFLASSIGEACTRHLTETPPHARTLAPAIPAELDDLLFRMLAKQPEHRPTLAEISAAVGKLATLASGLEATMASNDSHRPQASGMGTTLQSAAAEQRRGTSRRKGLALAIVALCVIAVGVVVAIKLASGGEATAETPPPPDKPTKPEPSLREPVRALASLARFADPRDASSAGDFKSEMFWTTTRDELDTACKQVGVPKRWCAGRDFAEGQIHVLTSQFDKAAEKFRSASALDPEWALPQIGLGNALINVQDIDGALAAARAAQLRDPTSWLAIVVGGRAHSAADRLDDAIVEYRRALAVAPENPVLMAEAALAYHAAGMDTEADKLGGAAFAKETQLASLRLVRAEKLLEQGKGKEALVEADALLAFSPKHGGGLVARGDALALLGDKTSALAAYQRAVDLAAKNPRARRDERLELIKAALAKNSLPPSRTVKQRTPPDRTHSTPKNTNPRSRPGCENNPLCGSLK